MYTPQIHTTKHGTLFQVQSFTDPDTWYQIYLQGEQAKCTCRAFTKWGKDHECKHIKAVRVFLAQHNGQHPPIPPDGVSATDAPAAAAQVDATGDHGAAHVVTNGEARSTSEQEMVSPITQLTCPFPPALIRQRKVGPGR